MSLKPVKILAALALMAGVSTAAAGTFVTWTSPTSGSANGVTVTASYTDVTQAPRFPYTSENLSGANFSPAGGATQQTVEYNVTSGITWSFSSAVTNLDLYLVYWRAGARGGGPADSQYVFSTAPTIQSGLSRASISGNARASISGNALVVGSDDFYSGIVRFSGPLTSLTLNAPVANSDTNGYQIYTLAFDGGSASVPDGASTFALLGAAIGTLGWATRRRRV